MRNQDHALRETDSTADTHMQKAGQQSARTTTKGRTMTTINQEKVFIDMLVDAILQNEETTEETLDKLMAASEGLGHETVITCQEMAYNIAMMRRKDQ